MNKKSDRLKYMIGAMLTTTLGELGFMPDEAGEQVKKIIASDKVSHIIALGCYLGECRSAGNYDPLIKGLIEMKERS